MFIKDSKQIGRTSEKSILFIFKFSGIIKPSDYWYVHRACLEVDMLQKILYNTLSTETDFSCFVKRHSLGCHHFVLQFSCTHAFLITLPTIRIFLHLHTRVHELLTVKNYINSCRQQKFSHVQTNASWNTVIL